MNINDASEIGGAEPRAKITFTAPAELARELEEAAAGELISASAFARRSVAVALRARRASLEAH